MSERMRMDNARARPLRAEATGSLAESTIWAVLTSRGYATCPVQREPTNDAGHAQTAMFGTSLRPVAPTRTVTAQYPIGLGIYGLPIFADFFLAGAPHFPTGLAIEVKWQQSPGSVDEKFPYLVHCIQACYPCPTVIVADGGGQRPGALQWLRGQCQGKLLAVYTLVEFLAWANRQL